MNSGHSREICSPAAASSLLAAGRSTEQELQPPLASSTITSPPVQLAVPHRQPTRTTVHTTNSWINAYILPSREGGEESREGPSTVSTFPPAAGQTPHQLPVLTIISASLILSLQKQQIPREDFQGSPSSTHLPISAQRSSVRHSRSYSSCTHLWLQTAASRSADSVNLCHLLPCLPGQLQ